ncbi:hypothetical protein X777_00639 [Ooceraea biroi]|uniref:Uncharacterized protein n=1 Tax=Ooceraea biroi TaxID=2015173 RepID=A0A026X2N2_OOCBI|nr:hypothetical protein X777_00639 [Ooceraea biroi]
MNRGWPVRHFTTQITLMPAGYVDARIICDHQPLASARKKCSLHTSSCTSRDST